MKRFLILLGDLTALYGALLVALVIRYGQDVNSFRDHVWPFTIVFAVWILVFFIAELYDIASTKNTADFFGSLLYAILLNAALSIAFFYLIPYFGITPKTNLFIFLAFAIAFMFLWRWYSNALAVTGDPDNNTLIIGANEQSNELYDYLLNNLQLGYKAIGIIDIEQESARAILRELIAKKRVSTLVIAPIAYQNPGVLEIIYGLLPYNIDFYDLNDFYEKITQRVSVNSIDQAWFLANLSRSTRRRYLLSRRLFDITTALIFGLISLIFYPFIFIGIKMSSPGPIFFRQQRIGRAGKLFKLIKFRTMIANTPDGSAEGATGAVWAQTDDPRVTKFGKFLRKSRFDEFPQFWNILMGEMSFVGPRAERPEFHEQLKAQIPFYDERYLVKPGITGWAQIKYPYGSNVEDALHKLQYDLYYIKNRSFLMDIAIILKTFNIMLRKASKYAR